LLGFVLILVVWFLVATGMSVASHGDVGIAAHVGKQTYHLIGVGIGFLDAGQLKEELSTRQVRIDVNQTIKAIHGRQSSRTPTQIDACTCVATFGQFAFGILNQRVAIALGLS